MNSALKDKVFDIPDDIISHLNKTLKKLPHVNDLGMKRIRRLVKEKQMTYQQLKRLIYDFKQIDPKEQPEAYELNGGEVMNKWANETLENARKDVKSHKDSKQRAAELTPGMKNAHIKTHEKDEPTVKLNENINRIKQLFI